MQCVVGLYPARLARIGHVEILSASVSQEGLKLCLLPQEAAELREGLPPKAEIPLHGLGNVASCASKVVKQHPNQCLMGEAAVGEMSKCAAILAHLLSHHDS
jgi:hypothetical protein